MQWMIGDVKGDYGKWFKGVELCGKMDGVGGY
jgi:hypothetical protein